VTCVALAVTALATGRPALADYPTALREAARARMHERAQEHALAADGFRRAFDQFPDLAFLYTYAAAAERAGWYAEAESAWRKVLRYALSEEDRARADGEATRLKSLVPKDMVRVAVQVTPHHARLVFESDKGKRAMSSGGEIYLRSGRYKVSIQAAEHGSETRTIYVGTRPAETFAVVLKHGGGTVVVPDKKPDDKKPDDRKPDDKKPDDKKPDLVEKKPDTKKPDKDPDPFPDEQIERRPGRTSGRGFLWGATPWISAGIGVAAIGAAGYFGWRATDDAAVANGFNPADKGYSTKVAGQIDYAKQDALLATIGLAVGGAFVVGSALLFTLRPSTSSEARADEPPEPGFSLGARGAPRLVFDGTGLRALVRF